MEDILSKIRYLENDLSMPNIELSIYSDYTGTFKYYDDSLITNDDVELNFDSKDEMHQVIDDLIKKRKLKVFLDGNI